MAENQKVDEENPESILKIHPLAFGSPRGWQRFLEILFPGIEQIQTRKKHWAPIRDFHRIVCWLSVN